jgi:hypothetical protein
VKIADNAKPGDKVTVQTDIGTYHTGNSYSGNGTQKVVYTIASTDKVDIKTPANNGIVSGESTTLTGTGAVGGKLTITDETGKTVGTVNVKDDGTWTLPVSGLADGNHTFTVSQKDIANTISTDTVTINVVDSSVGTPVVLAAGAGMLGLGALGAVTAIRRRKA